MKFVIRETVDSIEYVLSDRGSLTDKQLSDSFYMEENGVFLRRYRKQNLMFRHDFAVIEANYNRHKERVFAGGFSTSDLEAALAWIIDSLNSGGIKWWLSGSAALYVRGLDVSPHDIDVMTWKSEIDRVDKALGAYIIEPFEHVTGWVVKGFGAIEHDFRIDIAFEPEPDVDRDGIVDFGPFAESHLETIHWKGHPIRLPPLRAHLLSNERRGSTGVADLIRSRSGSPRGPALT